MEPGDPESTYQGGVVDENPHYDNGGLRALTPDKLSSEGSEGERELSCRPRESDDQIPQPLSASSWSIAQRCVSKDEAAPWFETTRYARLLTMRPNYSFARST